MAKCASGKGSLEAIALENGQHGPFISFANASTASRHVFPCAVTIWVSQWATQSVSMPRASIAGLTTDSVRSRNAMRCESVMGLLRLSWIGLGGSCRILRLTVVHSAVRRLCSGVPVALPWTA